MHSTDINTGHGSSVNGVYEEVSICHQFSVSLPPCVSVAVSSSPPQATRAGQQGVRGAEEGGAGARWKDRDMEYLREDLVRDTTLDLQLQGHLDMKRAQPKYLDMLVRTGHCYTLLNTSTLYWTGHCYTLI